MKWVVGFRVQGSGFRVQGCGGGFAANIYGGRCPKVCGWQVSLVSPPSPLGEGGERSEPDRVLAV